MWFDLLEVRGGNHYRHTYCPYARFSGVRVVMDIAAQNSLRIKQLDIKTTFVNSKVGADNFIMNILDLIPLFSNYAQLPQFALSDYTAHHNPR